MYKLNKDANVTLGFLVGKEICQVCIGSNDVQLNWGDGGISIWSKFSFKPAGSRGDVIGDGNPDDAKHLVGLLQASIISVACNDAGSLVLEFSKGDRLEIFEDEHYECFSISNGKSPLIVV
jgi:hypothetical protein